MTACAVTDCAAEAKHREFCKRCYARLWARGEITILRSCKRGSVEQRFWNHVALAQGGACWLWTGALDKDGYGVFRTDRPTERAHRYSYSLHHGAVPSGLLIRHQCNNPRCVNPEHLVPGTHAENMADRVAAGNYATGEAHHMFRKPRA